MLVRQRLRHGESDHDRATALPLSDAADWYPPVGPQLAREGRAVSEMDAERRKAAVARTRRYVGQLKPLLRLAHWEIAVDDQPPESDDASASVRFNDHDWRASVRLSDYFLAEITPEVQRLHLTHELVHLHFRGLAQAQDALITHFASPLWLAIDQRHTYELELCVDALAMLIAPYLPLPPAAPGES